MRKECQHCSECSGNFYVYFNPDDYINILLTFYDKIMLIACLQPRANIILCQRITSSFRRKMDSGIRYLSCLFQGDKRSQRPQIGVTDLLPKFTENEAPILSIGEVYKV